MSDEPKGGVLNGVQGKGVRDEARRAIIGAGAIGAAALAMNGRLAAAQPESGVAKTDGGKNNLTEREITYKSGDADIKAFYVEPNIKPKAAIIIIHEIWGLNAHIRDVARRFARQGYVTLAPDLYTREGAPNLDINDRAAMMKFIADLSDGRVVGDLEAGITYLNGQGMTRVGSMGFCMGGLYSYLLATKSENLNAAVTFYGRIAYAEKTANKPDSPVDLAGELKCPLLSNFGETDASIPMSYVENLRAGLAGSTQPWKVNVYPGAGHAFFNDTRPSFNAGAAADAGTEALRFFKKYLQDN